MFSFVIGKLFDFYYLLIIVRIFLSWIPNIDWEQQPCKWMRSVVDPFLNIFRGVIPPIGGLDISPMVAIILLFIIQGFVCNVLVNLGL